MPPNKQAKAAPRRVRRTPEEASALILHAAEELLTRFGSDKVGLQAVAKKAKVSHALVTHYFGTYDNLVKQVLARRIEKARGDALQRAAEATQGPEAMVDVLLGLVSDPGHVRLMTWAFLSARDENLFPLERGELTVLIDAVMARREARGLEPAPRETVEFLITLTLAAGYGFALGKDAFGRAFGHPPMTEADFFNRLTGLIRRIQGLPPAKPPQPG